VLEAKKQILRSFLQLLLVNDPFISSLLLGEEAEASPSIANTLWRV